MGKINPDDFLQPSHPRFKKVYKYDPIEEGKRVKRQGEKAESQRKADLERKYWEERYDPAHKHSRFRADERRAIEEKVLKED